MNEERINQVIDNLGQELAPDQYAPGASEKLTPLVTKGQLLIEDAERLCKNLIGAIDERLEFWNSEKEAMVKFGEWLIGAATKTAGQLDEKTARDHILADKFTKAIDEHRATAEKAEET